MGAWGSGPFDNDTALDWVWELVEAPDDGPLILALEQAVETPVGDSLDADVGTCALAAAETVAALAGARLAALPEDLEEWVGLQPEEVRRTIVAKLRDIAVTATERVKGPESELDKLWVESDEHAAWRATLDDVVGRLKGA